jgi:DNA-binding transcriptional regulator YiaG
MKKKYQSKIMESIHEEAKALFEAGVIDEKRMSEYDHACLVSKQDKKPVVENSSSSTAGTELATPVFAHPR